MNIEDFRAYCLSKEGVTEETPFGPETLVFKVLGKVFALMDIDSFDSVNLKCDPEWAVELRELYAGINGGYHMNKKHWNTVRTDGSVPIDLFYKLVDHSYDMVVRGLPKKVRSKLNGY
ncbi:MAG TPA: MmcQ/YjbR family DNA-binding protein [Flavobacteriales bacterium]|jgi:predicted DNA-binding protein (MmcQ/YjbR family)